MSNKQPTDLISHPIVKSAIMVGSVFFVLYFGGKLLRVATGFTQALHDFSSACRDC